MLSYIYVCVLICYLHIDTMHLPKRLKNVSSGEKRLVWHKCNQSNLFEFVVRGKPMLQICATWLI